MPWKQGLWSQGKKDVQENPLLCLTLFGVFLEMLWDSKTNYVQLWGKVMTEGGTHLKMLHQEAAPWSWAVGHSFTSRLSQN